MSLRCLRPLLQVGRWGRQAACKKRKALLHDLIQFWDSGHRAENVGAKTMLAVQVQLLHGCEFTNLNMDKIPASRSPASQGLPGQVRPDGINTAGRCWGAKSLLFFQGCHQTTSKAWDFLQALNLHDPHEVSMPYKDALSCPILLLHNS